MNRAHCVIVRACSWLAGHTGALIIGLAVLWMASAPPAWGQSAWPSYPNNTAISVSGSNVGIGTTTPGAALQVQKSGGYLLKVGDGGPNYMLWYGQGYNDIDGWGAAVRLYSATNGIQFRTGGADPAVTIVNAGNVGIGTTNPQYLLSVNGTIGTKDVIVTNTGWSDFVFQPGYRLRPLSEVGAYIQANHHLPDIPSEAEVKEKGVSVGDMQSKLLAKVEELTLHMIQADERNNRLEEQNQELRDRLARLEKGTASVTTTAAK